MWAGSQPNAGSHLGSQQPIRDLELVGAKSAVCMGLCLLLNSVHQAT